MGSSSGSHSQGLPSGQVSGARCAGLPFRLWNLPQRVAASIELHVFQPAGRCTAGQAKATWPLAGQKNKIIAPVPVIPPHSLLTRCFTEHGKQTELQAVALRIAVAFHHPSNAKLCRGCRLQLASNPAMS